MKITKNQLKQIIKEELEASLNEGVQIEDALELAKVFAQSPQIMKAVKEASQDPKIQAAAKVALTEDESFSGSGQTDSTSAKLTVGALRLAIPTVAGLLVGMPPVVALGITSGVAAAAVAILTFNLFSKLAGLDQ